jgi:hypothetical protein
MEAVNSKNFCQILLANFESPHRSWHSYVLIVLADT